MPRNEPAADPHAEGQRAAERAVPASDDPHPAGSAAHRAWEAGHASVTAPDKIADDLADFA